MAKIKVGYARGLLLNPTVTSDEPVTPQAACRAVLGAVDWPHVRSTTATARAHGCLDAHEVEVDATVNGERHQHLFTVEEFADWMGDA